LYAYLYTIPFVPITYTADVSIEHGLTYLLVLHYIRISSSTMKNTRVCITRPRVVSPDDLYLQGRNHGNPDRDKYLKQPSPRLLCPLSISCTIIKLSIVRISTGQFNSSRKCAPAACIGLSQLRKRTQYTPHIQYRQHWHTAIEKYRHLPT
jgi:hypothetical protein